MFSRVLLCKKCGCNLLRWWSPALGPLGRIVVLEADRCLPRWSPRRRWQRVFIDDRGFEEFLFDKLIGRRTL